MEVRFDVFTYALQPPRWQRHKFRGFLFATGALDQMCNQRHQSTVNKQPIGRVGTGKALPESKHQGLDQRVFVCPVREGNQRITNILGYARAENLLHRSRCDGKNEQLSMASHFPLTRHIRRQHEDATRGGAIAVPTVTEIPGPSISLFGRQRQREHNFRHSRIREFVIVLIYREHMKGQPPFGVFMLLGERRIGRCAIKIRVFRPAHLIFHSAPTTINTFKQARTPEARTMLPRYGRTPYRLAAAAQRSYCCFHRSENPIRPFLHRCGAFARRMASGQWAKRDGMFEIATPHQRQAPADALIASVRGVVLSSRKKSCLPLHHAPANS